MNNKHQWRDCLDIHPEALNALSDLTLPRPLGSSCHYSRFSNMTIECHNNFDSSILNIQQFGRVEMWAILTVHIYALKDDKLLEFNFRFPKLYVMELLWYLKVLYMSTYTPFVLLNSDLPTWKVWQRALPLWTCRLLLHVRLPFLPKFSSCAF